MPKLHQESDWKCIMWLLENHGIWWWSAQENLGKWHWNECTNQFWNSMTIYWVNVIQLMKSLHYPLTVVVSISQYCWPVSVACDTTVGIKCCPRRLVIIGKVFSLYFCLHFCRKRHLSRTSAMVLSIVLVTLCMLSKGKLYSDSFAHSSFQMFFCKTSWHFALSWLKSHFVWNNSWCQVSVFVTQSLTTEIFKIKEL